MATTKDCTPPEELELLDELLLDDELLDEDELVVLLDEELLEEDVDPLEDEELLEGGVVLLVPPPHAAKNADSVTRVLKRIAEEKRNMIIHIVLVK